MSNCIVTQNILAVIIGIVSLGHRFYFHKDNLGGSKSVLIKAIIKNSFLKLVFANEFNHKKML